MTLTIPRRFRGPTQSGNGGYSAGSLAANFTRHLPLPEGHAVEVTLRAPPPLDTPLRLVVVDDALHAMDGETLVLAARAVPFDVELPPAVDRATAHASSQHYEWSPETHPFPECFTCGPAREAGDGLRIFAGRPDDATPAACRWSPDASLTVDGAVPEAVVWAALDCPGYAGVGSGQTAVLGRMVARVHRAPHVGERCVAMGWSRGIDGRKLFAGTAVIGEDGQVVGRAAQTWIVLR